MWPYVLTIQVEESIIRHKTTNCFMDNEKSVNFVWGPEFDKIDVRLIEVPRGTGHILPRWLTTSLLLKQKKVTERTTSSQWTVCPFVFGPVRQQIPRTISASLRSSPTFYNPHSENSPGQCPRGRILLEPVFLRHAYHLNTSSHLYYWGHSDIILRRDDLET